MDKRTFQFINNPFLKHPLVVGMFLLFLGGIGFLIRYYLLDDAKVVNQTPNEKSATTPNTLPMSIYALAEQVSHFPGTSIEKEDFFKKYIGLRASDEGNVFDVFNAGNKTVVRLSKDKDNASNFTMSDISCTFNSQWSNTVKALQPGQKIMFEGIIYNYTLELNLYDCELKDVTK